MSTLFESRLGSLDVKGSLDPEPPTPRNVPTGVSHTDLSVEVDPIS